MLPNKIYSNNVASSKLIDKLSLTEQGNETEFFVKTRVPSPCRRGLGRGEMTMAAFRLKIDANTKHGWVQ